MANFRSELVPFPCDWCGTTDECRFEYIDERQGNLPMLFCSLDCLERFVDNPLRQRLLKADKSRSKAH